MNDTECIAFLRWALPNLDMRWAGFRKVRGQVCKRIKRRMSDLEIEGFAAYRDRLEADSEEWRVLDECCHITISRFYRDKSVFEALRVRVLPTLAAGALRERSQLRCWSAGCASGEESYTLSLLWDLEVASSFPGVDLSITATDIDKSVLVRAHKGCYGESSLRDLPAELGTRGFDRCGDLFCVKPRHQRRVTYRRQDLRSQAPSGPFDLILCRNLAFTYFAPALQRQVLARLLQQLKPRGHLIIGVNERLPREASRLSPLDGVSGAFALRPSDSGL